LFSDEFHMVALAGLEENPRLQGWIAPSSSESPREAMHHALQFIKQRWGGVSQYLVQAGFGLEEQQQLRDLLLIKQCTQVAGALQVQNFEDLWVGLFEDGDKLVYGHSRRPSGF